MDTQTATLTGNGLSLTRTKAPGTKTWPTPPAPTLEHKMYSGLTPAQFLWSDLLRSHGGIPFIHLWHY